MGGSVDRAAIVAALCAVRGVAGADLEPDPLGGPGTLRLDLDPGVDEAGVASAVSQLLREQFGIGVDIDRVQLLRAAEEPTADVQAPAVPEPRSARPSITKVHLVSAGLDVTATVTLASGQRTATGEAHGLASSSGAHRAVAAATLRAVETLVDGALRVELEHLEIASMGMERTVVVLLTLLTERGTESLTGAAAVRDDVRQAVIRATLDALNRRLELLLTEV